MEKRLERPSQKLRLLALLRDRKWHKTTEILNRVYGLGHSGIARIGARIADIKDMGYEIDSRPSKKSQTVWEYRIVRRVRCYCGAIHAAIH